MSGLGPMQRLPTESSRPMVLFALTRLGLTLLATIAVTAAGLPYGGSVVVVLLGLGVPWSLLSVYLARTRPGAALNPLIAVGDLVLLALVELVAPETYGAVRFLALALLAVHAHFQGERIGIATALFAVAVLAGPAVLRDGEVVGGGMLTFYELAFAAAALMTVTLTGHFRTAESASRLRARELTRRTLQSEQDIRRELSQALHDGPVQELIGLGMTLAAAERAAAQGDARRSHELIREAREVNDRSVETLRGEMLDLGPYAYDEISYEAAVERCVPLWQRRFAIEARLEIDSIELPSELEGELFRITQEAVANAARHGEAGTVTISLRQREGGVVLRVADDGRGFGGVDPLGATEPGHIGLASIRERAELMRGELRIESGERGTSVVVMVPLPRRSRRGARGRAAR